MEKEKLIEEMAKEIATVLFCDCLLNNGGRCCDCECNKKETKEYDCQSYLVAKKQFEQGYRKQEDILHEWVDRETAYLNEIAELKKELDKELAEHEEFTKKAKAEIERLKQSNKNILFVNEYTIKKNEELQKQVDELNKENARLDKNVKWFQEKIENGELVSKQAVKDTAKEILQMGKYCMPSGLRDWIKERYGVEVE